MGHSVLKHYSETCWKMSSTQDSMMVNGQGTVSGFMGTGFLFIQFCQNPKQKNKWSRASFVSHIAQKWQKWWEGNSWVPSPKFGRVQPFSVPMWCLGCRVLHSLGPSLCRWICLEESWMSGGRPWLQAWDTAGLLAGEVVNEVRECIFLLYSQR